MGVVPVHAREVHGGCTIHRVILRWSSRHIHVHGGHSGHQVPSTSAAYDAMSE